MYIFLLIVIEIILMVASYYLVQRSIFAPAFIFVGGFYLATLCAAANQKYWGVVLHGNTFIVLSTGMITFVLITMIIRMASIGNGRNKYNSSKITTQISNIHIPFAFAFTCLHLLAIYFTLKAVVDTAAMYGVYGSLMECIFKYRNIATFTTNEVKWTSIGSTLYATSGILASFWAYVIARNWMAIIRKIYVLPIINFVLCIICSMLTGGRNGALYSLISFVVLIYIFWSKKNNNCKRLPLKYMLTLLVLACIIVLSFQTVGTLLGRNNDRDLLTYISVYLGAPIKNLDSFLQASHNTQSIWGQETFAYLINNLGEMFNIESWIYTLDLPYQYLDGKSLGNVYTTFYMFYYDFGFIGVILCTAIIAAISQIVYEIIMNSNNQSIYLKILYSLIISTLVFSFFSNKFFETFVCFYYIKKSIILAFTIIFLTHFKYSFNKREKKFNIHYFKKN